MLNTVTGHDLVSCLSLLRLCSPGLPVGAYSYSQGLEWAMEAGWLAGDDGAGQWVLGLLRFPWTYLEVPVMARLHQAWSQGHLAEARRWNAFLLASRESAEMQDSELSMGQALARLLTSLGVQEADAWRQNKQGSFAAMFALAAARWGINHQQACAGYLWCLAESLVSAAIKLVPLGQTTGQQILSRIIEAIPLAVSVGLSLEDAEIGYLSTGLAVASALHESQHTRLFRS